MGFLKAKCERCWDPIPCGCEAQQERDAAGRAMAQQASEQRAEQRQQTTDDLLRENNALLRSLLDEFRAFVKPKFEQTCPHCYARVDARGLMFHAPSCPQVGGRSPFKDC